MTDQVTETDDQPVELPPQPEGTDPEGCPDLSVDGGAGPPVAGAETWTAGSEAWTAGSDRDPADALPVEDEHGAPDLPPEPDLPPALDDRLRSHLDESAGTPGGRAFYEPDDTPMFEAAQDVPPAPGQYTVDMHGDPAAVYIGPDGLSADDLGTMLEHDPTWNGEPVRLFACETGQRDDGFGQQVADRLGLDVTAPTELAWSEADGTTYVTSQAGMDIYGNPIPTIPPDGQWRVFHPRMDSAEEHR